MREIYLGDSYDLVKRFWCETLKPIAPMYSYPQFVPAGIRSRYTAVTSIPILGSRPDGQFGLLFDPHTGIPLPTESRCATTASHASLSFMVQMDDEFHPEYMICFDQSYHREHKLNREQQRTSKRQFLQAHGIESFYYVSHAPFLFMARKVEVFKGMRDRLISRGIPATKLEA
jgi:hypothetical protein